MGNFKHWKDSEDKTELEKVMDNTNADLRFEENERRVNMCLVYCIIDTIH